MAAEKKLAEKSRWIPTDYESLARLAADHFTDRDLVKAFFRSYENISDHTKRDKIRFYQTKYFYTEKKWECLNQLAECYLEDKRPSLAYMCLVESLRLNTQQEEVFQKAQQLEPASRPKFPGKLPENTCKVTVITGTMGRTGELRAAVKSVLNQTFQDFEYIIVNDGGPDTVDDIITEFNSPKIKYIKLANNMGIAAARNAAICQAQGKYIAYMDDDDIYYPDHLENLVQALDNSYYMVAYSNSLAVEGMLADGKFMKTKFLFIWGGEFDKNKLAQETNITVDSIMHQKSLFEEAGLFNEEMSQGSDWDQWLRFAEKYDFTHVNKSSIEWRHKADNMTLMNRVGAHILGDVYCHFYVFYKGKFAFLKYWKDKGKRDQAFEIYQDIKLHYDEYFKTPGLLSELIDIAQFFRDRPFLRKLSRDYFRLNTRMFLDEIKKRKSAPMLMHVLFLLPQKIVRGIVLRVDKKLKRKR
jgi:glycosyltransferase involved in cell wall biosynthesis